MSYLNQPKHSPALLPIFLSLLLLLAGNVSAQSTIFATPSTDILPEGKVGIRFIARFKLNDQEAKKKFTQFTPRVIFGVKRNVEIGVNLLGNTQPGQDATTIVGSVKWRFYANEKRKTALVVGNNLYIPLRNKKYNLGNYFYVAGSKVLSGTNTKLTIGSYYFTKNVVARNAARAGGQFGLEQPINQRVTFAAEWLTGRHSSGNLTTGFKVKVNKRAVASLGYTIANDRAIQGNHFFYTSLAINLN